MKPGFALSLSFEGISLLQRAAGGWRSVGEVSLEAADLAGDLGRLRDKAKAFGSGDANCKIIIPNAQIRYLSVETGSFNGEARLALVRSALQGATPYPVEDLVFDLAVDESITHVAAVARETLAEAEAFAVEHGFNPLCFVATPGDNPFLGEPFFGACAFADTLPGKPTIEADGIAVVVIGPAIMPATVPVPEPAPDAQDAQPQAQVPPQSEPEPAPVTGGFTSRRKSEPAKTAPAPKPEAAAAAPSLGGATRDAPPGASQKPAPLDFRSVKSQSGEQGETKAPTPAPPAISVTEPTLDIPEAADTIAPVQVDGPSDTGGFLSRRNRGENAEPARASAPIPPAPAPIPSSEPATAPELTAVSRPSDPDFAPSSTDDEAARLTVFGARGQAKVGGKPRHLGLILAGVLLLFLVAIAAWASIFLENGVAGLLRAAPVEIERADAPQTPDTGAIAPPEGSAPDTLALVPPPRALDVASLPPPRRLAQPDQPAVPDLTDTDSAVLDALRQPEQPEDLTEQAFLDDPAIDPVAEIAPETGELTSPEALPGQVALPPQDPATELTTDQQQANLDAVTYAATGILQRAPQASETPTIIGLNDIYVASIDRTDLSRDAVALPPVASLTTDRVPGAVSSPVAAGTEFALDSRGLVEASVQGTLNPGGVMVFLGRPARVPPALPARLGSRAEIATAPAQVAGLRPRLRPRDLEERVERTNLGGLTRQELSGMRPKARPQSPQQLARPDAAATAQAVVASRIPRPRPGNFAAIVSAAVRPPEPDTSPAATAATAAAPAAAATAAAPARQAATAVAAAPARTAAPTIPSSASVARQATLRHQINLRRVNLIGVYGTPSNRRALVRLPSGRYKRVQVGDSVDGGRVVAIGDSELRYKKSGRNLILKIPSS